MTEEVDEKLTELKSAIMCKARDKAENELGFLRPLILVAVGKHELPPKIATDLMTTILNLATDASAIDIIEGLMP
jgi:hypothetical protein